MTNPFAGVRFLKGVSHLSQLPVEHGVEVAFAGRSNAGKSSAMNKLTGSKSLARTSKTPGRTREINFFGLPDGNRLVDLPGYGYAKVSKRMKAQWGALLADYLRTRQSLVGVVVIMDCRHPLTDLDCSLIEWCGEVRLPVHVLFTKCDKLSRGKATGILQSSRKRLTAISERSTGQLFSAHNGTGLEQARQQILAWLSTLES